MKLSFPEVEVTRLLYNKILKNNQVTYGMPFQVKIPIRLQNIAQEVDYKGDGSDEDAGDEDAGTPSPEELIEKARSESELIMKEASLEADRLLEQTRLEAEQNAEMIAEEAWQKGYSEGMEAARLQNEAILEESEEIRRSASEEHDSIMAGLEAEVVELALGVARKVVSAELATNRDVILQLVKEALDSCSVKNGAVLRVSPMDYDTLNEDMDKLQTMAEGADSLEVKKDSTLSQGDCIVETSFGSVDAGVETRLNRIEEAFREQLEGI